MLLDSMKHFNPVNFHRISSIYSLDDTSGNACLFLYFRCLRSEALWLDTRRGREEYGRKSRPALSGNDMNLTSLFTTDHHNSHDGADFLAAELGIFNKTISEVFPRLP